MKQQTTAACFFRASKTMFFESKTMFFYQKKMKVCFVIFFIFFNWCWENGVRGPMHQCVKKWYSRYQTLVGICTLLQHMHTSKIYLSLKDITRIDVFSVCGPMGGKWGWICTDLALPLLTEAWWAPKQDSAVHMVQITQSSVKHPN